jgi:hypothetical protein
MSVTNSTSLLSFIYKVYLICKLFYLWNVHIVVKVLHYFHDCLKRHHNLTILASLG